MNPSSLLFSVLFACSGPDSGVAADIPCGSTLTCTKNDVCVQQINPAVCENRQDTGLPCPEGTTASQCGGAGLPCCCAPAPEATWQCWDATSCGDSPTCDCVGSACPADMSCTSVGSATSGVFQCEEPAMP